MTKKSLMTSLLCLIMSQSACAQTPSAGSAETERTSQLPSQASVSVADNASGEPLGQTLDISFSGVTPETGKIWVGVCTQAQMVARYEDADSICASESWLDAANGATVRVEDIAPGTYAITAFHDADDNGQLDFDTRGIPFEATGNGNNARGVYGPPTFEQMKFDLPDRVAGQATLRVTVALYQAG